MNMRRLRAIATVALAWSLCEISLVSADSIRTDANIVTAIDISDSVDAEMLYLEIEGMARALRSPTVLRAIQSGRNGRIGFAVFAWSHGGGYPELVSWTLIASELDAARVSVGIAHWLLLADQAAGRQLAMPHHSGRLTDISEGINHATQLFLAAPYVTHRQVLNIIGNGEDNLGENPEHARDRLLSFGSSINGVVLGKEPAVLDYYRRYVVGGPGAFYLFADDPNSIAKILELKLLYDLNADLVSRMVQRRPVLVERTFRPLRRGIPNRKRASAMGQRSEASVPRSNSQLRRYLAPPASRSSGRPASSRSSRAHRSETMIIN
jgi:Ca-activated chloride channel homolog